MLGPYKILIAVGVVLAMLGGSFYLGDRNGEARTVKEYDDKIAKDNRERNKRKIKLVEVTKKTERAYRDKIQALHKAGDSSGCADTRIPDNILHAIRDPGTRRQPSD